MVYIGQRKRASSEALSKFIGRDGAQVIESESHQVQPSHERQSERRPIISSYTPSSNDSAPVLSIPCALSKIKTTPV